VIRGVLPCVVVLLFVPKCAATGRPATRPAKDSFKQRDRPHGNSKTFFTRFFPNSRTRSFQRLILCILAINHCNDGNGHAQPCTICKLYFRARNNLFLGHFRSLLFYKIKKLVKRYMILAEIIAAKFLHRIRTFLEL
jgi:hypothetical protein